MNQSRLSKQDLLSNNSGIERIAELRQRHSDLAGELDVLSTQSRQAQTNVADLQAARTSLNEFISSLALSVPREPVRDLDRGRGKPILPPNLDVISVLPEVPYERVDSLDSIPNADELDSSKLDGYRRIFWRASESRIHAIGSGKVSFSGPFSIYDHLLIIDHGDGWSVVIANLSNCLVKLDDVVGKGQVIGQYAASTSRTSQPLWIEVRRVGEEVPIEQLPGIDVAWANRLFGR